jgi:pantoate--beta-alanine ligase
MVTVKDIDALRDLVAQARAEGKSIGLVPTMGALHEGHASLLRAARQNTGYVVASIFVNPTQFGPAEDLERYPRTLDEDLAMCRRDGVDLVFTPTAESMYPPGFRTFVEVHGLQDLLCGATRPGHFRGVATVVLKLFLMVRPDLAYFGQKDAQQARIIEQMVSDLNAGVQIVVCPIIRESDGLALSSRNRYLTAEERRNAVILYQALEEARARIAAGERDGARVRQMMTARITAAKGAVVDYAAVVDTTRLQPIKELQGSILLAVAVRFGQTRLIDNMTISIDP